MFEFSFDLVGLGWAEATLSDSSGSTRVTASYLGDALGELLLAIKALLEGNVTARCTWWEEPGEYRWLFSQEDSRVHLRIVEFRKLFGNQPDDDGLVIFQTVQPLAGLAAEIARASHAVLGRHSAEGYRETWIEHEFPFQTLASIDSALVARHVTFRDAD